AGDVFVPEDLEGLVRYLRTHSSAGDPIFCRTWFMNGPEIYFLADRRNPTRFDVPLEVITSSQQREILDQLERDPPLFVIGSEQSSTGDGASRYLDEGWQPVARFGELVVSRRKSATTPTPPLRP